MPGWPAAFPVPTPAMRPSPMRRPTGYVDGASPTESFEQFKTYGEQLRQPSAPALWRNANDSFAQIVAVGFGNDLPAVGEFHRHQIIGEIARRQLAAHLDEGGGGIRAVDGDNEILARLALRLGRRPLLHPLQPVGHAQHLQLALFQPAQIRRRVKDRAQCFGTAFIQAVEIVLDHGFDGGTVVTHGGYSGCEKWILSAMAGPIPAMDIVDDGYRRYRIMRPKFS